MLELIILGIFAMVLMSLGVSAKSTIIYNETFNQPANNWSLSNQCEIDGIPNDLPTGIHTGILHCNANSRAHFLHAIPNLSTNKNPVTIEFQANISSIGDGHRIGFLSVKNETELSGDNFGMTIIGTKGNGNVVNISANGCGTGSEWKNITETSNTWQNWKIVLETNSSISYYINNTIKHNAGATSTCIGNVTFLEFGEQLGQLQIDNLTIYNGTSTEDGIPTITIYSPADNSLTHNMTPPINFSITDGQGDNLTNLSVFLDKQANPTTRINISNTTGGFFSWVLPLLNNNTEGSINGTYYLKINGTDNSTSNNFFIALISFNLTNNISSYNATNVSLTPLPLNPNTAVKCHYNITNFGGSQINDNISITDLRWWINGTQYKPANNLTTLNAGNATLNANITCEVRINNGYGETSWTQYVNTSQATVGDTTTPTITAQAINGNSFTTAQRVNISANCTDNILVDIVRVEHNGTGTYSNSTATLLGNNVYSYNALFGIGKYNVTNIYCADGSGNIARDASNFTFTVTSPPSGDAGSSGGGGGGTTTIIKEKLIGSIPILSFGGLTTIDFLVLATPTKQTKIVRFANLGNTSFENAKIFIQGGAEIYVNPYICDIDLKGCKNTSINIKPKESKLLSLNGTFTEKLEEGTSGVIKIQEQKENGNTYELNLLVSRPPFWKLVVKPFKEFTGLTELPSLIISYILITISFIGGIWIITII